MFSDRDQIREFFYQTWQKHKTNQPLSALERQVTEIILQHPEYHSALDTKDKLEQNYPLDQNPFLHLGLHLSLLEQLNTDRPTGIRSTYLSLLKKYENTHQVEHLMLDVLAELLWTAQQQGHPADEKLYLEKLKRL